MSRLKRPELHAEAARRNREQLARLGSLMRAARKRRRLTQLALAGRVGVSQPTISLIERGLGSSLSLDVWQRAALALDCPLRIEMAADPLADVADAGHLAIQELVLRLARASGVRRMFELPSRPADPARSVDVGLRDDVRGLLMLVECWNTIGDIGASARATSRKAAELEALAVATGGERKLRVGTVWVVRATRRNRQLVARYPAVFSARFPGSSAGWVRALCAAGDPPIAPGLVWCDVAATRVFPWRKPTAERA